MKHLLTVLSICISIGANAQITLEHTYSSEAAYPAGFGYDGYASTNVTTGQFNLYNASHQLIKSISIPSITDYSMGGVSHYGDYFTANGEFAVLISYTSMTGNGSYINRIYTENNAQIFNRECTVCPAYVGGVGGEAKLIINLGGTGSEVYSLPGTWPYSTTDIVEMGGNGSGINMYPNPSSSFVSFEITEPSTIELVNMQGQVSRSYSVNDIGEVTIPINDISSGTYIVNINDVFSERLIIK